LSALGPVKHAASRYHLPKLQGRLGGNPVQLGRKAEEHPGEMDFVFHWVKKVRRWEVEKVGGALRLRLEAARQAIRGRRSEVRKRKTLDIRGKTEERRGKMKEGKRTENKMIGRW